MTQPIDIVNAYRALAGKAVSYDRNERSAERYINWCTRHKVDPIAFMKARVGLAKEGERAIPSIGALPSQKLLEDDAWLEILDRIEGGEQDAAFVQSELAKEPARARAALLASTPAQEKFKRDQRDRPRICMEEMQFSGGYHPHSGYCRACEVSRACGEKLDRTHHHDVVSLRVVHGFIGYPRIE